MPNSAWIVFGDTAASVAIAAMVVAAQPCASNWSLAACRIASRVWAAAGGVITPGGRLDGAVHIQ